MTGYSVPVELRDGKIGKLRQIKDLLDYMIN